jgi:mannosyltransferase
MTCPADSFPKPQALYARSNSDPEVIVFNLKKRYTGVSATVNALVPLQLQQWKLAYCGTPLPNNVPGLTLQQAIRISKKPPAGRAFRIWHVRRDHEMLFGLWARDALRLPIRLVFTSAAQHRHGWFPRWLISRMDAVISTTPLAASFVPNTTAVVPHGIDLSRFGGTANKLKAWTQRNNDWGSWRDLPGEYAVGIFGRIRPDKGSDVFIDAMIRALPQLPQVTAVIAGLTQPRHRDYQKKLQAKINAARLQDRIVFLGEVPAGEVHLWYQRCLVCVACPRYEPFGLTPFEAAATGCALICSRTGAFEQLVENDVNGYLVGTDDPQGLADCMLKIFQNPERAAQMGQAAKTKVTQLFSLAQEAAGITKVYEELFCNAASCSSQPQG